MSQQSPEQPLSTPLLNSQNVPLVKLQQGVDVEKTYQDLIREAGRVARQLEGLTKAVRRLHEHLKEAT